MDKVIGKNLKAFREANRLTQEQVASFLQLNNRSTYSNYESGDRETPYEVLERCADLYGCETLNFFEENQCALSDVLSCAFRVDGLSEGDLVQVAKFKSIVKTNLKLNKLLSR